MPAPVLPLHPADDPAEAAELVALQRAAYAVEERLIGHAIPVRGETAAQLAAAGLRWWGVRDHTGLLGAVAVSTTGTSSGEVFSTCTAGQPGQVDDAVGREDLIDRLVVAPRAFRRGVGAALVAHVVREAAGRRVTVTTGTDNAPARRLYERAGFTVVGRSEVAPGLWVTHHVLAPPGPSTG